MAANPGSPRPSQLGMPKLSTSGPAQVVVVRRSIEALQAYYAWSLQSSTQYTRPDCRWPGLAAPHKSHGHQTGGTYWQVIQSKGTNFRIRGTLYGPPYMYGVLERCHVVPPTTKSRVLHFYAVRESLRSRQHSALTFKYNISISTADRRLHR